MRKIFTIWNIIASERPHDRQELFVVFLVGNSCKGIFWLIIIIWHIVVGIVWFFGGVIIIREFFVGNNCMGRLIFFVDHDFMGIFCG